MLQFFRSSCQKIKTALSNTRAFLGKRLHSLLSGKMDEETLEKLEQLFYEADLGIQTAEDLTEKIKAIYKQTPNLSEKDMIAILQKEVISLLSQKSIDLIEAPKGHGPTVILVVGANGNGKTTAVAKLAKNLKDVSKKVLIAATDTFRAAGIEQLEIWARRLEVDFVKGTPKSDPAAVAFDAITAGKARGIDVIIIDTAGRLHTRLDLMKELQKIRKTCQKLISQSPHETLLVVDATIGQNGIDQAKVFNQYTPLTGLILTKLDGTAKGGIIVNIQQTLKIPVKFIGVGESVNDLEPFQAENFAYALFD